MVKETKKAPAYLGITYEDCRSKSEAMIKVNGVEIEVSDYLKDPKKYNTTPMDPQYVEECQKHLEQSISTKKNLQIDPSTIKSML